MVVAPVLVTPAGMKYDLYVFPYKELSPEPNPRIVTLPEAPRVTS